MTTCPRRDGGMRKASSDLRTSGRPHLYSTPRMIRSFPSRPACRKRVERRAMSYYWRRRAAATRAGRDRGVLRTIGGASCTACVWILSTRRLLRSRSGSILGRGRSSTPTFRLGQLIARRRTAGRCIKGPCGAPRRRRPRGGRPRDAVVVCVKAESRLLAARLFSRCRVDGVEVVSSVFSARDVDARRL